MKLKSFLKNHIYHRLVLKASFALALALILAFCALCFAAGSFFAYGADSDEIEEEIEEAQEDAEKLQQEIDSLNDQLSSLSEAIEDLNTQITEKEEEIAAIEEEIAAMEAEIEENEEDAEEQYEALLTWIKVSYENGFDSLFMSVMSAETFSEVISQAEYVQSLSDFGIDLIERYDETLAELEAQKEELQEQEAELTESLAALEALEEENSDKKEEVSDAISRSQDNLEELNDTIDSLEEELEEQLAYEAELEAQKAAAAAAAAALIAAQEAELAASGTDYTIDYDYSDLALLAALIYCEAGGESYEGQVAVGCVVINRVRSSSYPNTVSGVIYQSSQFSPVASGRLATVLANNMTSDSCYEAAAYVLAGNLPYPSFLCFCSASIDLGISTTVIGNHQFY